MRIGSKRAFGAEGVGCGHARISTGESAESNGLGTWDSGLRGDFGFMWVQTCLDASARISKRDCSDNPESTKVGDSQCRASPYWGQGLANEALTRVLLHARDRMQMRRIEADVDPRNSASLRCSERLGFVREGYARERWVVAGEIQGAVLLGLLLRDLVVRV